MEKLTTTGQGLCHYVKHNEMKNLPNWHDVQIDRKIAQIVDDLLENLEKSLDFISLKITGIELDL